MNQSRRKVLSNLAGLSLLYPLAACGKGNLLMKKEVVMDVVVFHYTNRPIFEVLLNNRVDGGGPPYGGGNAIVVGVTIPLGPQSLTWRDAGSGKTFTVTNSLNLEREQIPADAAYLAIHIYPDGTAELTFAH